MKMKKRILIGVVALVLLLTLVFPAQLMAKSDNSCKVSLFQATAEIAVIDPGIITVTGQYNNIVRDHQVGEIIAGTITKSDKWAELNNATIQMIHNADSIYSLKYGTFTAMASGTITLYLVSGEVLSGTYTANVSGTFTGSTYETISYTNVVDTAVFTLKDGKKTVVTGTGLAYLIPIEVPNPYSNDPPTLTTMGGIMTLAGVHY